jgi:hypothetical protein
MITAMRMIAMTRGEDKVSIGCLGRIILLRRRTEQVIDKPDDVIGGIDEGCVPASSA